jgi:hypothetical protein
LLFKLYIVDLLDFDPQAALRPRCWSEAGTAGISGGNGYYRRVVQSGKVPAIVHKGITHAKRRSPDIAGTMHPVWIAVSGRRRSDMDMNV